MEREIALELLRVGLGVLGLLIVGLAGVFAREVYLLRGRMHDLSNHVQWILGKMNGGRKRAGPDPSDGERG